MSSHTLTTPVSIRSPHRSEGRQTGKYFSIDVTAFQSAPLTEARGDTIPGKPGNADRSFNPLPSSKRGETYSRLASWHGIRVSIRSPHRSEGRLNACFRNETGTWFQSAPLTEARGDRARVEKQRFLPGFNPLPSPKRGETHSHCFRFSRQPSFNPLPSPKRGETCGHCTGHPLITSFNPLPSPKRGETPEKQFEK